LNTGVTAGRPQGRPATITRDQILGAAMRLCRWLGMNGLTMKDVAHELGVTTMALYYHVPTKHALLCEVADAVLSEVELPAATVPWDQRLYLIARRARDAANQYPGLLDFVYQDDVLGPTGASLRMAHAGLAALSEAGFDDDTAAVAHNALRLLASVGRRPPMVSRRAITKASRTDDNRLLQRLRDVDPDEEFEYAMRCMLDGLRADAERRLL
jgi:AcrR family transcriptional regulator